MNNNEMTKLLPSSENNNRSFDNYKQLLETLNVIPWEFDWGLQKFVYVGPQASQTGYPIEEWYMDGFLSKLIHPDDFENALCNCKKAAESRDDYEYEFRIIRADGQICWFRKIVRIVDGCGNSVILRGIFLDITVQKQAEEILLSHNSELRRRDAELSAKNEQFNVAIENMSQGLSMFDSEKRLIICNNRYAQMYQMPAELVRPGTRMADIMNFRMANNFNLEKMPPDYIQHRMAAIDRREQYALIQELANGCIVEVSHVPMPSGGWLSTHEDITERRRAEKALHESREALSIAFRLSPVSMTVSDPRSGEHFEVNDAWSTMLGYTREDALANTALVLDIWHDLETRKKFVRKIKQEGVVRELEAKLNSKDGRVLDVLLSGEIAEINGREKLLIACHDVTKRKKSEKELIAHRDHLQEMVDIATRELKEKAEALEKSLNKERELNELQRQFVSMASHEFRTPLAIIDSTAQRLIKLMQKNRLTPEDARNRYDKIRASVQRMTALMESTLTAARMEEGRINVEIGPCKIGKIITDACLRQQEITHNHKISCHLDGLPEIIQADSGAIEQVLANLLSNAEKYAPDAPQIDVRAYRQADEIVVCVHDNGIGIDEDELDRIGERFFRAKTSTGIPGTGIGLNLSIKLLEMHNGSIQIESRKTHGSTFTIRLPVAGPRNSGQINTQVA